MPLLLLIALAIISYTLYTTCVSLASKGIDATLSTAIFNGIGVIIPLIIYFYYHAAKPAKLSPTTTSGITYSVLAGIFIALFCLLLLKIFTKGGLAYVAPLIYGGTIVLSSLIGWLIFKETLSPLQILGIAATSVGIGLIVFSKL